ncbi:DUF1540 domain-containing protein [bacterium]|nr:DUF1540 domain-containing protein [bacterium]
MWLKVTGIHPETLNIHMKQNDQDKIWESYIVNEDIGDNMRASAGRIGKLHTDQPAGEAGKPWGDETPVLEGVNCDCQSCAHWIVGDLCKAESINIVKRDGVPACGTYTSAE